MPGSPVPIYLGCAGLIVGSLGLGAQHLLGGNSVLGCTHAAPQPPLFARSVEEAALPATRLAVAECQTSRIYDPMVELLTAPARSTQPRRPRD